METTRRQLAGLIGGCLLAGLTSGACWADGGAVRAIERDGPFQISVFTSPTPLVAGPVDISVLVQDAETQAALPDTPVLILVAPRRPDGEAISLHATSSAASNKLLRACLVELEPGWYEIRVRCGSRRVGKVRIVLEVGPPRPRLAALWPWFTWPVVPVALFSLHAFLMRKKLGKRPGSV